MRRVADEIKMELGQAQHLAEKNEAKAVLDGFNEAMQMMVDDIKANPDLPAGLARRRMDAILEEYKPLLLAAQNTYDRAQEALDDINDQVNQALGIYTDAASLRARDRDDMRQQLNMFINSGMIGGMTDGELEIYAGKAGVPTSMLMEARELAKSDKKDADLRRQALQKEIDESGDINTASGVFTQTQINKGAANAGLSIEEFGNFDPDTANAFVQGTVSANYYLKNYTQEELLEAAVGEDGLTDDELKEMAEELGVRSVWKPWSLEKKKLLEEYPTEVLTAYFNIIGAPVIQ
jgi:hypothetical protein